MTTQNKKKHRSFKKRLFYLLLFVIIVPLLAITTLFFGLAFYAVPVQFDKESAKGISFSPLEQVVPGPALPDTLQINRSNNNLDLVLFKDRYYFAFRTAPTHFASAETRMYILSSKDLEQWEYETEIFVKSDMREPRFLVLNDKLLFYFFEAGATMTEFMPKHTYVCELSDDGSWSEPQPVYKPGYVFWRIKSYNNLGYAAVYYGAGIYMDAAGTGEVRLLRSEDGYDWQPISEEPQLFVPGAEETAFVFSPEGDLTALVRLELAGGSLLCTASADDLAHWKTTFSPMKYDSSLMFTHDDEIYVIARRNIAGTFDKAPHWLGKRGKQVIDLIFYSLTRKRTALYHVDRDALTVKPLFDFPSRGDTAFPGIAPAKEPDSYYVLNYSSPIDKTDWPWIFGQLWPTNIYGTTLKFEKAE